jgi:hypothetical protein
MPEVLDVGHYFSGGVSNVDIDGNNTLQIKALGVTISTFETRPFRYYLSSLALSLAS